MSDTRQAASLTWFLCRPPVDEHVLAEHERILGVTFPQDLREVLRTCHGGHPVERAVFWFEHPDPEVGYMGTGLGALVTLDPEEADGMLPTARNLREYQDLPVGVIPFATTGGGDFMCLDYREDPHSPKVVYWVQGADPRYPIPYLADSFTEFLAMLEPDEPLPDD